MIDDIIRASYEGLRLIRKAEKERDYVKLYDDDMTRAEVHLDFLRRNSPLLYACLLPEYIKERDHKEYFIKLNKGGL